MATRIGLAAALLAGILWVSGAGSLSVANAASAVTLDLVVENPGGHQVQMSFLIRASSEREAREAALAALPQLMPQGKLADTSGQAAAQFAPWGWHWAASEMPVPVVYNPSGGPAASTAEVASALRSWSSVPGSAFAYAFAGTTDAAPGAQDASYDGQNVIGWINLSCAAGCVLGVTSKVDDVREVDIVLNSNPEAKLGDGLGGSVDIETTILHEAGHMAGLEHSCQPFFSVCSDSEAAAVMFFRYTGIHRTLGADDLAGVAALYPQAPELVRNSSGGIPVVELSVRVQGGWTLSVLPAGPIGDVMRSLQCVSAVYELQDGGNWLSWLRGAAPGLNTVTQIESGRAYWLFSSGTCSASFAESRP
jgi:hypothetical protein